MEPCHRETAPWWPPLPGPVNLFIASTSPLLIKKADDKLGDADAFLRRTRVLSATHKRRCIHVGRNEVYDCRLGADVKVRHLAGGLTVSIRPLPPSSPATAMGPQDVRLRALT